jgi:hypothetical protein
MAKRPPVLREIRKRLFQRTWALPGAARRDSAHRARPQCRHDRRFGPHSVSGTGSDLHVSADACVGSGGTSGFDGPAGGHRSPSSCATVRGLASDLRSRDSDIATGWWARRVHAGAG